MLLYDDVISFTECIFNFCWTSIRIRYYGSVFCIAGCRLYSTCSLTEKEVDIGELPSYEVHKYKVPPPPATPNYGTNPACIDVSTRLEEERRRREEEDRLRWMRETEERRRLVQQHMANLKRQRALEAERGKMAKEDALALALVREEKRFVCACVFAWACVCDQLLVR